MTSLPTLQMLMRYNAWANQILFQAIGALPPGEATRERPTLFNNIVGTLNHVYLADVIWQAHLQGSSMESRPATPLRTPELENLWRAQQEIDAWYLRFANRLSQAEADETVRFKLLSGTQAKMRRGDMLLHVVNHTSYHRGFVADLFHQIPVRPPETDLPVFLRSDAERGD